MSTLWLTGSYHGAIEVKCRLGRGCLDGWQRVEWERRKGFRAGQAAEGTVSCVHGGDTAAQRGRGCVLGRRKERDVFLRFPLSLAFPSSQLTAVVTSASRADGNTHQRCLAVLRRNDGRGRGFETRRRPRTRIGLLRAAEFRGSGLLRSPQSLSH